MKALNKNQREAMLMLQDMRRRYPDEHCDGSACGDSTYFCLGATWPAFINWRTAKALERRGLITYEFIGYEEGADLKLTDAGLTLEVKR